MKSNRRGPFCCSLFLWTTLETGGGARVVLINGMRERTSAGVAGGRRKASVTASRGNEGKEREDRGEDEEEMKRQYGIIGDKGEIGKDKTEKRTR